jgi:outer membrane immunogenic protein
VALLSGAAHAADLIVDAPIADAPATFDWNGFYAGVGIAYEDWSGPGAADSYNLTAKIGGNAVMDMFVLGAEGYVTGYYLIGPNVWQAKWGADVRAGALVTDTVLLYGLAGLYHDGNYGTPTIYGSAGAGIEFAVSDAMSIDLRYRYSVDLDTPAYTAHGVSVSANWHF